MNNLSRSFLALSTIGIFVAIYHGYDELTHYSTPLSKACNINSLFSCGSVFNSGYTTFLGVSLYVYGLVWFPLMVVLGYWLIRRSGSLRFEVIFPLLMVGNLFTIYLWYLEFVKIHAFCPVCIGMYVLNYLMTAVVVVAMLTED